MIERIFAIPAQRNSRFPILGYTLYKGRTLIRTDLEMQLRVPCAIVGLPDNTLLQTAWLKAALAASTSKPKALVMTAPGYINNLPIPALPKDMSAADFPSITTTNHYNDQLVMDVQSKDIEGVALAMADKDVRYYLNGLCVDFQAGALIATDGHRLHHISCATAILGLSKDGGAYQAIIPCAAILALIKVAGKKGSIVRISYAPPENAGGVSCVRINIGDTIIVSKTIAGNYPDYTRVMPALADRQLGAITITGTTAAATIFKQYAALGKAAKEFPFAAQSARISTNRLLGHSDIQCPSLEVRGAAEFAVHLPYLAKAMDFVGADGECTFNLGEGKFTSALAINGSRTAVVMPCRV